MAFISGLIIVLIICALVAAIWGREAGKKLFGCIGWSVAALAAALFWWCMWLGGQNTNNGTQQSESSPSQTYPSSAQSSMNYSPNQSQSVTTNTSTQPVLVGITQDVLDPFNVGNLRLPAMSGIMVVGVVPNSRAESAGVQKGDIITKIDGVTAGLTPQYPRGVAKARDEDMSQGQMVLTIFRSGSYRDITIPLT